MKVTKWKNGFLRFAAENEFDRDVIREAKKFDCMSIRKSKVTDDVIILEPRLTPFCRSRVQKYIKRHGTGINGKDEP
jgi:hypothetical protein